MSASLAPKRHSKYYLKDGNVVFLTNNNMLFWLHKSILQLHSTFFEEMFGLKYIPIEDQAGKEIPINGSSDKYPIRLGGGAAPATLRDAELEPLCKVLYFMPGIPLSSLDIDEVTALFSVSSKFQFDSIYRTLAEFLNTIYIPPWERYSMGITSHNESWLLRSCIEICCLANYPPPELFEEFSSLNVQEKLSELQKVRESCRIILTVYAYNPRLKCSTVLDCITTGYHSCSNCRPILKDSLRRILIGNCTASELGGSDPTSFPLLKDRLAKIVIGSSNICSACRTKEDDIVAEALGPIGLERMTKKAKHLMTL